jgi:phenylpropionate dioxygenase-like ring-hydroxylating dioxygenase large terminal subunit
MLDIRRCPINLNYWYAVAQSKAVKNKPLAVSLWHYNLVLYRDKNGKVHALEDCCPHRQVKLSEGKVVNNAIECAYHGWKFDSKGKCFNIPYLTEKQAIPNCSIPAYPVVEKDGFIWVYLGDQTLLDSHNIQPLSIPEWEHLNYIATVSMIDCQGHFSFLIENLMDVYHGHLHDNYQA